MTSQPTDQHLIEYLFDHHRSQRSTHGRVRAEVPPPCSTQTAHAGLSADTAGKRLQRMGGAIGLRDEHRTTASGDIARLQSGTNVVPPLLTGRIALPSRSSEYGGSVLCPMGGARSPTRCW